MRKPAPYEMAGIIMIFAALFLAVFTFFFLTN